MASWTKDSANTTVVKVMTSLARLIARFNVRSAYNQLGLDRKSKSKEESDSDASEKSTIIPKKVKKPIAKKKKVFPGFIKLIQHCAMNHVSTKEKSAVAVKDFWIHWNKTLDLSLGVIKLEKQEDGGAKKRQNEENLPSKKNIKFKNNSFQLKIL